MKIHVPEFVRNLQTYKPGKPIAELAREKKPARIVKLASNENPLGPSPKAMAAIEQELANSHRYVEPRAPRLVEKLAGLHKVSTGSIVCGHGSDSLIAYIINAFSNEGDEIVTSRGTFIGIYVSANKLGRRLKLVDLKDYAFDLEAIADAVSEQTRIVYLANPNNPTGMMFPRDAFKSFMGQIPESTLVILDEAYHLYAEGRPGYPDGVRLSYPNLIVCRTLSKAYGLAGLRIGYAVGPEEVIEQIYKVKLPFEPNNLAQAAALEALKDDDFLAKTAKLNVWSLAKLQKVFDAHGIQYPESAANFIMTLWPTEEIAKSFADECLNNGLILRHVASFGIPEGVRINSGTEDETEFAVEVIERVIRHIHQHHALDKSIKG
ncbi:MAG: histidinol-phosphate transaminase [Candidatus Zixiibacteriota bacterium]